MKKINWKSPSVVAFLTIVGTLLSVWFGAYLTSSAQIKLNERQQRQQIYSKLIGKKYYTEQLLSNRYIGEVTFRYYEMAWILEGKPKDSLLMQEYQNWGRKFDSINIDVGKNYQELYEILGLIQTSFPRTEKLDILTDKIYNFKSIDFTANTEQIKTFEELEKWKTNSKYNVNNFIGKNYTEPIDNLIKYLDEELKVLN